MQIERSLDQQIEHYRQLINEYDRELWKYSEFRNSAKITWVRLINEKKRCKQNIMSNTASKIMQEAVRKAAITHQTNKEAIIRNAITFKINRSLTTEEIPERLRSEIHPDKEIIFLDNQQLVEFPL